MKTRYYTFGGQVAAPAYRWKGYTLPTLTRNAAETRGLSGDPETEYLPYRASGPEPLDPGELGDAADGLGAIDFKDPKTLLMIAAAGVAAWCLFKSGGRMRKNPSKKKSSKDGWWIWDWVGGGGNSHHGGTRAEAMKEAKSLGRPSTYGYAGGVRKTIGLKVKPGSMRWSSERDKRWDNWD